MIRIVLDALGGDNAPGAEIEGAVMALKERKDIELIITGDEQRIKEELSKHEYDQGRVRIVHTTQVITCEDQPTAAIKQKKDSSMVKALELLAAKEADCFLSAGSTGAVLAGATFIVKRIKGVKRPALAPLLPTQKGPVLLIDCGANVDSKPVYLEQFAIMGDAYMKGVLKIASPRVGLINNGAEAEKGNELTKSVYPMLQQLPINFVGNCEAREIASGDFDVLVCDGFVGNVVLKFMEGMAKSLMHMLKEEIFKDTRSKLGALILKPAFSRFKKKMDYTEYGGAPLLGVEGGVIKAHGSSNAKSIYSAMLQAAKLVEGDVVEKIREGIKGVAAED